MFDTKGLIFYTHTFHFYGQKLAKFTKEVLCLFNLFCDPVALNLLGRGGLELVLDGVVGVLLYDFLGAGLGVVVVVVLQGVVAVEMELLGGGPGVLGTASCRGIVLGGVAVPRHLAAGEVGRGRRE